ETFTAVAWDVPGIARGDSAWGDYDKDGDLDLLLTGYAGYSIYSAITRLYKNDGSGGFEDATVGLPGLVNGSLEWGDFDNDGDLDIALAGESDAGAITRVYRNDSGAFVDIQAGIPGVVNGDVAWGDRDNDGDLDLLVTGDTGGAGVATLFDNSNGTFTDANVGLPALTDSAAE
ncbi:MAG: VCBS repeat-containing protein, partial [Chloroflexi bacterium]|nr:VCBS repeat-containing protein [Chloroflexota bacterium]